MFAVFGRVSLTFWYLVWSMRVLPDITQHLIQCDLQVSSSWGSGEGEGGRATLDINSELQSIGSQFLIRYCFDIRLTERISWGHAIVSELPECLPGYCWATESFSELVQFSAIGDLDPGKDPPQKFIAHRSIGRRYTLHAPPTCSEYKVADAKLMNACWMTKTLPVAINSVKFLEGLVERIRPEQLSCLTAPDPEDKKTFITRDEEPDQ